MRDEDSKIIKDMNSYQLYRLLREIYSQACFSFRTSKLNHNNGFKWKMSLDVFNKLKVFYPFLFASSYSNDNEHYDYCMDIVIEIITDKYGVLELSTYSKPYYLYYPSRHSGIQRSIDLIDTMRYALLTPRDNNIRANIEFYGLWEEENKMKEYFNIKKVIFNAPATIVIWSDGSKTIVKATNEPFDPEKGLAMCIAKKALGNQGKYYNEFKKWLTEEETNND